MVFTVAWVKGAAERAIKTFAQVLVGFIAVDAAVSDVAWQTGLEVALAATIASVLTSIGNADFTSGVQNEVE